MGHTHTHTHTDIIKTHLDLIKHVEICTVINYRFYIFLSAIHNHWL